MKKNSSSNRNQNSVVGKRPKEVLLDVPDGGLTQGNRIHHTCQIAADPPAGSYRLTVEGGGKSAMVVKTTNYLPIAKKRCAVWG